MGLSIGTVQIEYGVPPDDMGYRFAWHLAEERDFRCWQVLCEGNAFVEMEYEVMVERAAQFIEMQELSAADAHALMRWIRDLPWRKDGMVMLHMGW